MTIPNTDQVLEHSTNASIALPISSQGIADLLGGKLIGNPTVMLDSLGSIETGDESTLTFIRSKNFANLWSDSACGCALVSEGIEVPDHDSDQRALIVVEDSDVAMVKLLDAINPGRERPGAGIHSTALIDPGADVDASASIGARCVVGRGSVVSGGVVMMPGAVIGADCTIGSGTIIESGVVIEDRCVIGSRCHIGANSVIGSDGFGYLPPTDDRGAMKVPQIGTVVIGDEVELGACVTVDRAKFSATTIGDRSKIDNQVHVAHNCVVGTDTLICGRTTLGGSVTIGDFAMIGGAVVLNDHATIGKHAKIAGGASVLESVPEGETYAGIPAIPARQAMANYSSLRDISSILRKIDKRLKAIEKNDSSSS